MILILKLYYLIEAKQNYILLLSLLLSVQPVLKYLDKLIMLKHLTDH